MRQLPLAVRLRDFAVFGTFEPGPNGPAVAALADPAVVGPALWIWGPKGSGKSHLLQAACAARESAAYLPAAELLAAGEADLDGWSDRRLVCLDDIDRLAGRRDWELAVFRLFNSLWESGSCLVVSASGSPAATGFLLPDLRSRLAWGGVYHLAPLSDEDRVRALCRRASHRGLEMPEESARYLLKRLPRDMPALCAWLDRLDLESLAAGKRLTVPFVRSIIDQAPADAPVAPS
jgi:DnaA-homolog protein